jgi:hypothetical protein
LTHGADARATVRGVGSPSVRVTALATAAAFGAYFSMYAFRKPFTAASYSGASWAGVDAKTLLVAAQVLGYTLSKFIGIRVVSQLPRRARARTLLALVGAAHLALVGFALAPLPWQLVFLFLNGLPLGMVFGLVLGFLEGRRHTEIMAAGLCASFIVADGATKTLGAWLLAQGVAENWMPFTAGALFAAPLVVCVALLQRAPEPDAADVASRSERAPMDAAERAAFLTRHGRGLALIVIAYLALTTLRSLRADFAPELWRALGEVAAPRVFTSSELLVALGVVLATASTVRIQDNRRAFLASISISVAGLGLCLVALVLQALELLSPFGFMVALGLGLYLPYVAVHATLFERLVAMTRDRGTISFLMYLADSFGYLGYVAVMFGREFLRERGDVLEFFVVAATLGALLAGACFVFAGRWFAARAVPAA